MDQRTPVSQKVAFAGRSFGSRTISDNDQVPALKTEKQNSKTMSNPAVRFEVNEKELDKRPGHVVKDHSITETNEKATRKIRRPTFYEKSVFEIKKTRCSKRLLNRRYLKEGFGITLLGSASSLLALTALSNPEGEGRSRYAYPFYFALYGSLVCVNAMNVWRITVPDSWDTEKASVKSAWVFLLFVQFATSAVSILLRDNPELSPDWVQWFMAVIRGILSMMVQLGYPTYFYFKKRNWLSYNNDRVSRAVIIAELGPGLVFLALSHITHNAGPLYIVGSSIVALVWLSGICIVMTIHGHRGPETIYPAIFQTVCCSSYGPLVTTQLALSVDTLFRSNGLLRGPAVLIFTSMGTQLMLALLDEMLQFFPFEDRDRVIVAMFPIQFTQEFVIGAIFLETAINLDLLVIIILVAIMDINVDSGLFHELYHWLFKTDQSARGKWLFLRMKYQMMQQKVLGELLATPLLAALVTRSSLL